MSIHSYICMKPLLWNTQTARISQQIGSWGIFHLAWHEKWPSGNRCSVNASCKNLASIKLMTVILKLLEVIFQPLEVIFQPLEVIFGNKQQQKKNALKNWRHENHFYLGLIHGLAWTGCGSFCSNSSSNKGERAENFSPTGSWKSNRLSLWVILCFKKKTSPDFYHVKLGIWPQIIERISGLQIWVKE